MPQAILASRPVKNTDSGLDLTVTSYKETKGMMTSTVFYQVVLVSNLNVFKTPSHKESDVVQFTIEKKYADFELLRTKVCELFETTQFGGEMVPSLGKKSLMTNDAVLKERRNSLNSLVKFFASVPKIATCGPVLEFLGIDSIRAKKFTKGEPLEEIQATPEEEKEDEENVPEIDFLQKKTDGDDEEDVDLFGGSENDQRESNKSNIHMFEEQDFKRELDEEDEKEFGFVQDAIVTRKEKVVKSGEDEDNSDLFKIEDDLDELMKIDISKKKTNTTSAKQFDQGDASDLSLFEPPKASKSTPLKPSLPAKPKPNAKPQMAPKPTNSDDMSQRPSSSATQKPKPAPRPSLKSQDSASSTTEASPELGQDDIMKYLQDSLTQNEEDVDLFS